MASEAKKELVTVFIPVDPAIEEDDNPRLFVSVNGISYNIACGTTVEVPKEVADVLQYAEAAKKQASAYKRKIQSPLG